MPISSVERGDDQSLRHCAVFGDAFSAAQCAQLIDVFTRSVAANGGLVVGRFDQKVRQSSLVWLPEREDLSWVDMCLAKLVAEANRQLFGFALDGFEEQMQMAEYGPGHYYDWHIDRGQGSVAGRRKLTVSVQLTQPDLYLGGALEINADGHPFEAARELGSAVAFAATTLHRVAPIVSGVRHSLVAWVHGPAFV